MVKGHPGNSASFSIADTLWLPTYRSQTPKRNRFRVWEFPKHLSFKMDPGVILKVSTKVTANETASECGIS